LSFITRTISDTASLDRYLKEQNILVGIINKIPKWKQWYAPDFGSEKINFEAFSKLINFSRSDSRSLLENILRKLFYKY
jgi:hypothetical protein